jgi:hypothetical protein
MYQDGHWRDIAFLLSELCVRPTGPNVERAWRAIRLVTSGRPDFISKSDAHLWKPLQRLMAKAEAEREKALTEQRENVEKDLNFIKNNQSFPRPEEQLLNFDFGVDRPYPLHMNVAQNGTAEPTREADTRYLSNSEIPVSDHASSLGVPIHAQHLEYSRVTFGAPVANPEPYIGISEIDNPFAAPYSSSSNINIMTDNDPLDWVMQDDMAQQLVLQPGLPTNGSSDKGFPEFLGGWSNWF